MSCRRCFGRDSGTTDMCLPCEEAVEREQLYDELYDDDLERMQDEPPAFGEADADYQHETEYVPPSGLL